MSPFGRLLLAWILAAMSGIVPAGAQTTATTPPTVVELFTSQGCSSCPPSDRQLGELSRRRDVLALSLHVDYWDYIGWKDPFAASFNTERQRGYARSLRQRYVYTPEMVVGGLVHDPGSDAGKVDRMLRMAAERTGPRVTPVLTAAAANGVAISVPQTQLAAPCDIWLLTFDRQHSTNVARGENKGATLTNHNVVRSLERLATWNGQAASWTVPAERISEGQSVAVLVQQASYGPIIGAARLDRKN
jgi:hypothetical protein